MFDAVEGIFKGSGLVIPAVFVSYGSIVARAYPSSSLGGYGIKRTIVAPVGLQCLVTDEQSGPRYSMIVCHLDVAIPVYHESPSLHCCTLDSPYARVATPM